MEMDDLKDPAYPFDQGWRSDPSWKADSSWSPDRGWAPERGWSRLAEPPRRKPGNGGASFVAWEQKAEPAPALSTDWPPPDMFKRPAVLEPGFYLVPRSMSGDQVLAKLFPEGTHLHLVSRIKALNPTFNQGFKGGEMFVLGDLLNPTSCLREEAELMAAAAKVRVALEPLSEEEADFMAHHQAEIAAMLGGAGDSLGVSKDALGKGVKQIGETLNHLEYLHQRQFSTHGHLRSPEFFGARRQLLRQLDAQLKTAFLNKQLGLGSYPTLRRDLGISTRSLVHHWSKAGAPGQIPGYATHMDQVAKAAQYLKYGGYLGVGLGGYSSYLNVQEVCRAGETGECRKIRFTETGSFVGGLGGGAAAAWGASHAAVPICGAIGVASSGVGGALCAMVVVGGASYGGGKLGDLGGEWAGEEIYEVQK